MMIRAVGAINRKTKQENISSQEGILLRGWKSMQPWDELKNKEQDESGISTYG